MRMELSHAYLEQYHYKALSNPLYKIEGMMDVLREEMIMNMPVSPTVEIHQIIETNQDIAQKALILAQEERIDRQQLEIDIAGMKKGYHTHDKKKRNII